MYGSHLIKSWARTQAPIALSSAEAELYSCIRGSAETLGLRSLLHDFGVETGGQLLGDASAALGLIRRQGLGKLRHLECHSLWVQQRLRRKEFELRKVLGTANPVDVFTKHTLEAGSPGCTIWMCIHERASSIYSRTQEGVRCR